MVVQNIVVDFSGMYLTYFLNNKYEVLDKFSQFKAKYENLTDKRIKKIRTDNGLEFVNEQLDTYLVNSGILHEKTIPYSSESNGKAERANRVLLERARSILYETDRTRPDISFVTSYLSQFNHNPEKRHYSLAKRVLRYLMGSQYKKLFYKKEFGVLNASSDASWGNAENGKLFSGGVVFSW
ncbi:retrovirus-related Pol polyprotein from transposon TNT 1-94 [Trichonephila clavipes]|nr:retrovirus-related Pol polyprotein from transposon TNT 1-94 [Trichonephila clavipes]